MTIVSWTVAPPVKPPLSSLPGPPEIPGFEPLRRTHLGGNVDGWAMRRTQDNAVLMARRFHSPDAAWLATATAEMAGWVEHPNAERIMAWLPEQGILLTGFVEGLHLSDFLNAQQRPLAPDLAALIVHQVCAALHARHVAGRLRGPFGASSVILCPDGRSVLCGGVFSRANAEATPGLRKDATPEERLGAIPDARSDVFHAGCLLARCLSSRGQKSRSPTPPMSDAHDGLERLADLARTEDRQARIQSAEELAGLLMAYIKPDVATVAARLAAVLAKTMDSATRVDRHNR